MFASPTNQTNSRSLNWQNRIIVGGLPRSGSTLFRLVLNSSKDVICPSETGFFARSFKHRKKHYSRAALRVNRSLEIGERNIESCILSSSDSIEAMDKMMLEYKIQNGLDKCSWAEKTPRNCRSYSKLADKSAELKFISMIRDGRDVVTSKLKSSEEYHCSIQRYIETMQLVLGFKSQNHKIVKYEDLVANPVASFKHIFDWLRIPFHNNYVTLYEQNVKGQDTSSHKQDLLNKPITSSQISRWKKAEYKDKVTEFMSNKEAVRFLESSGYHI